SRPQAPLPRTPTRRIARDPAHPFAGRPLRSRRLRAPLRPRRHHPRRLAFVDVRPEVPCRRLRRRRSRLHPGHLDRSPGASRSIARSPCAGRRNPLARREREAPPAAMTAAHFLFFLNTFCFGSAGTYLFGGGGTGVLYGHGGSASTG